MITLDEFEAQWLEEVTTGEPSTTQLGHRFAEKILRDWHEIDSATSEIILCDGAGDGGIDAAVFVPRDPSEGIEGDTWLLVQSKFGTAFNGAGTISAEAQKVFATLEGKREKLSSLSAELVERLRTFLQNRGAKDRLEYVLATTKRLTNEELEYLDNIKTLGRAKFGECFDVDSVSVETIYNKVAEEDSFGVSTIRVKLKTVVASSGSILLVGATRLTEIFRFMQAYKAESGDLDLLYEKNVRKFLGNKRKVNKGIEQTLEAHPERFGLYNNGVTIVAEAVERVGPDEVELSNPFIVNGCQTTRSIWSVLQRRLNAGGTAPTDTYKQWLDRLETAVVITKIVVVGSEGEELLTETTRYTNSQNAVGEKDFIALEKDFRTWAPAFNSKYGVFLEIQRGAWEARRAYQRQNPLALPHYEEAAYAFDLLKAYAAGWLVEPGIAYAKNPPFAPGGTLFNRIIGDGHFGVDALYAAFRMQKLADGYGFGRGAKKQTRGQTRYLFIMVAVDLVRDFLLNNQLDYSHPAMCVAIAKLHDAGLLQHVGDAAVELIDDYLTVGNEDCLFLEPEFLKMQDLNAFLKSEKLGKGEDFCPKLRTQISMAKRLFRRNAPTESIKTTLLAESSQFSSPAI
ncbi:AIPR family protein [Ralstonia mojiangensis]|uniref:AIPR family protein n=1 Tax=Ralstonia mojiangensis TaxID=2953895 RepID=UPI0021B45C79|nr:AIPR family protein [Ralstonia mojiangensis]MCT7328740.1 AIPR family protein [Ralstonia mojiangensis]